MNLIVCARRTLMLGCLLVGLVSPSFANLLTNGGFEDGTLSNWFAFPGTVVPVVDSAGAQEGTYSVHADIPGDSGGQVYQKYAGSGFVVGKTLYYHAYVKSTVGTGGTPQIYLSTSSKVSGVFYNVTVHNLLSGAAADLPSWTPVEAAFTVQTGPANEGDPVPAGDFIALRIHMDTPGVTGNSTLYVDNVSLDEVIADPVNRLSNPGFELGFASWQKFPTTIGHDVITSDTHGGARALMLTLNQVDGYAYQTYDGADFYTGSDLHFGAWYKASFAASGGSVAIARDTMIAGGFGNDFVVMTIANGDQSSWTYIQSNGVLAAGPAQGSPPANAGDALYFRLFGLAGTVPGTSTVYWDDAELWPSNVPVELSNFELL